MLTVLIGWEILETMTIRQRCLLEQAIKNGDSVNVGGVTSSNHASYEKVLMGIENMDGGDSATYLSKDNLYTVYDNSGNKIGLKEVH